MREIFSKKLFTARRLSGFTLEYLASETQLSKQTLSKYENGQVTPNSDSLLKLSEALDVKIDYFFSEVISLNSIENLKFREEDLIDKGEIDRIKLDTLIKIENYLQIEKLANEVVEFKNPVKEVVIKNTYDAKKVAGSLRKKWKIGNEPLRNVIDTLERKGMKIIELVCSSAFNGLSGHFRSIPVIVINASVKEITRRRFTILHELGHLMLNIDEDVLKDESLVEYICNAFAGAILLPKELMEKEFGNRTKMSYKELFELKKQYGASVQSILFRAADMKLLEWDKYHEWKDIGLQFNTGSYDIDEKSERLLRLALKCLSKDILSIPKAALLTGIKPTELKRNLNFIELQ